MTVEEALAYERVHMGAEVELIDSKVFDDALVIVYDQLPRSGKEKWGNNITRRIAIFKPEGGNMASLVIHTRPA